jgi:hypothetical protein
MSEIDEELFLMTNLYPASTGLPMVIWVGPSYGAQHDVRIKVMQAHGTRMDPHNLAVVALRPQPHVVAGQLSAADLRAVSQWIALNQAAIIDHWNGVTDGVQLGQELRRLPPGGAHPQRPAARTTTLHTITSVKPLFGGRLQLTFEDEVIVFVDLSAMLVQGGLLEVFSDWARFETVEVALDRHTILWRVGEEDIVELSADTLWLMAHSTTLHTITWIKPFAGGGLNLTFDDKPEIQSVDLSATLAQGGVFEPLRDQALFGTAEIGPNRRAVLWRIGDRIIELSAEDLWQMAHRSR